MILFVLLQVCPFISGRIFVYTPKLNFRVLKDVKYFKKVFYECRNIRLPYLIINCPDDLISSKFLANILKNELQESRSKHIKIIVNVSICAKKEKFLDPWVNWNMIRMTLENNACLHVALELKTNMPNKEQCERWFGEPVKALFLPSCYFYDGDRFGLVRKMQNFIENIEYRMLSNVFYIIKEDSSHPYKTLKDCSKCLRIICSRLRAKVEKKFNFFPDCIQYPMQPLKYNLSLYDYEGLEKDHVKYSQYESVCFVFQVFL